MDNYSNDQPQRKSFQHLPRRLLSLSGLNRYLTSEWIESVAQIIDELPSAESSTEVETPTTLEAGNEDLKQDILKIEAEIEALTASLKLRVQERRVALNEYNDLRGNIQVFCRIRPFLPAEISRSSEILYNLESNSIHLRLAEKKSKQYMFDKVFCPKSNQAEVFGEIESVIKSAIDGYNVCIFAYGQTSTGKTYTMEGKPDDLGVMPRSIQALFSQAKENNNNLILTFSMLEIYMGSLRDMLAPQSKDEMVDQVQRVTIKMGGDGGVELDNLVAIEIHNFKQFQTLYEVGSRLRSTASTAANSKSSRSHCLIRISITNNGKSGRIRESNKLWMIDLAGSERILKTQATGRRLQEAKAINLSLSALGDVIDALQTNKPHVPYRNSKLTQVLRDSLGCDSKVLMLVHVSPREDDICETICTLGFATRVRSINLERQEEPEEKAKRELALINLDQKIKELESECRDIHAKVSKHSETLEHLKGLELQRVICQDTLSLAEQADQPYMLTDMNDVNNLTTTSKKLQSFMKPTASSFRKTGSNEYSLGNRKKPPAPSKRRPSSVYAESVRSQAQVTTWQSDCSSEISISTVGNGGPNQFLQDERSLGDYEIKQVIFLKQINSAEKEDTVSAVRQFGESEDIEEETDIYSDKADNSKWLHSNQTICDNNTDGSDTNSEENKLVLEKLKNFDRVIEQNSKHGGPIEDTASYRSSKSSENIELCSCGLEDDCMELTVVPYGSSTIMEGLSPTTHGGEYIRGVAKQMLQLFNTLWAILLLVLGIQSIGLGDDFFYSLMS